MGYAGCGREALETRGNQRVAGHDGGRHAATGGPKSEILNLCDLLRRERRKVPNRRDRFGCRQVADPGHPTWGVVGQRHEHHGLVVELPPGRPFLDDDAAGSPQHLGLTEHGIAVVAGQLSLDTAAGQVGEKRLLHMVAGVDPKDDRSVERLEWQDQRPARGKGALRKAFGPEVRGREDDYKLGRDERYIDGFFEVKRPGYDGVGPAVEQVASGSTRRGGSVSSAPGSSARVSDPMCPAA